MKACKAHTAIVEGVKQGARDEYILKKEKEQEGIEDGWREKGIRERERKTHGKECVNESIIG